MMDFNRAKMSSLCSDAFPSLIADSSFQSSTNSSPRSFTLLDTEGGQDPVDKMDRREDVSSVMTQILEEMQRIVEHFRDKGEHEAANIIAKNTTATVQIFNETIAPWDTPKATMRPVLSQTSIPRISQPNHHRSATEPSPCPIPSSWAAVAAVAPAANNKLIKYTPDDALQMKVKEVEVIPITDETDSDMRVVWVRGWSAEKGLSGITEKIGQGAIYSMTYSASDNAVCIIFQSGHSAKALCADDKQYVGRHGHSRFGPGCDVVEGLPYPNNDDLRRMLTPMNERRRLTFARSQLFAHGMTEDRFKSDIHAIVGESNVELVWLFNSGNATVVFSAVPLARMIRSHFIKISRYPNSPYQGISIGFSHDPCERPMTLITQMTGRTTRPATIYGCNGVMPAGVMNKGGPPCRRNTVNDFDGWHVVSRRR